MARKIRVLVGKPGLDGHDRGAKVVAAALRDAGMEVIYTGLHQSADQIVEAAVQEDVDVVALSILSGAHMTLFPEVFAKMGERGLGDRLLTGGGIIPPEDMESLARQGIGRLFGPGTSTRDIAAYIHEWCGEKYGAAGLAPLAEPPALRPMETVTAAEVAHHAPTPARARAASPAPAKPAARATKRAVKPAAKPVKAGRRPAKAAAARRKAARPRSAAKRKPAKKSRRSR
jgi:methylmalonyl-CoA mutase C-terminal domain/subunit